MSAEVDKLGGSVEERAERLYGELVDTATLSAVGALHRGLKLGLDFLFFQEDSELTLGSPTPPKSPRRSQRRLNDYRIYEGAATDVFGGSAGGLVRGTVGRLPECPCPQCGRPIVASRFAPHLEKCMGMGRISSRIATRRLLAHSGRVGSATSLERPPSTGAPPLLRAASSRPLVKQPVYSDDDSEAGSSQLGSVGDGDVDYDDDDLDWAAAGASSSATSRRPPRARRQRAKTAATARKGRAPRSRPANNTNKLQQMPPPPRFSLGAEWASTNESSNESFPSRASPSPSPRPPGAAEAIQLRNRKVKKTPEKRAATGALGDGDESGYPDSILQTLADRVDAPSTDLLGPDDLYLNAAPEDALTRSVMDIELDRLSPDFMHALVRHDQS